MHRKLYVRHCASLWVTNVRSSRCGSWHRCTRRVPRVLEPKQRLAGAVCRGEATAAAPLARLPSSRTTPAQLFDTSLLSATDCRSHQLQVQHVLSWPTMTDCGWCVCVCAAVGDDTRSRGRGHAVGFCCAGTGVCCLVQKTTVSAASPRARASAQVAWRVECHVRHDGFITKCAICNAICTLFSRTAQVDES
jgi:hypothetical protein